MQIKVDRAGKTESGKDLKVGDTVTYKAHVPGGNVRVELPDGSIDTAHPACFKELR